MDFIHVLACLCGFCALAEHAETEIGGQGALPREGMEESHEGNASPSVSTATPTTDMVGLDRTKITVQPLSDPDCRNIATDFVYDNNHCLGVTTPESYLVKARSRYTCFTRCGQTPSLTEDFSQCGCDELCFVFRDCCGDMAEMCPYEFSQTHNSAYPQWRDFFTNCGDFHQSIIAQQDLYSTVPPTVSNEIKADGFKHNTLAELMLSLKMFQVVDLTTRLLFYDYNSYTRLRTATSVPVYVPKVAGLSCRVSLSDSRRLPTVLQILSWCNTVGVRDVVTPYNRPCKKSLLQRCLCAAGDILIDHVHNSCLGQNISHYRKYRYPLWDTYAAYRYNPPADDKCSLVTFTTTGSRPYDPKKPESLHYSAEIRITPVFHHNVSRSVNTSDHIARPDPVTPDAGPNTNPDTELVFYVEFTNTVEQSFVCPSMQSYIKDCIVVKCVSGAVLWIEDFNQNSGPARRSCAFPTEAKVYARGSSETRLCTCLHVLAILNGLDLWETRLEGSFGKECVISLVALPRQPVYFNETYTFTEPDPVSTAEKNQIDSRALSKLLATTSQHCLGEVREVFEICFFTANVASTSTTNTSLCLTWGGKDTYLSGSGTRPEYRAFGYLVQIMTVVSSLCLYKF